MLEVIGVMLLWLLAPAAVFCLFWKFGRPFWSLAVYLPVLLCSVVKNVFWYGGYRGFLEEISMFLHNDSVLMLYYCWLPSIIGFALAAVACRIVKKKHQA